MEGKLYLVPVGLGDADPQNVIPSGNIEIVRDIRYFIVENARTARRWLRRCDPQFSFDGVEMVELNRHTPAEAVSEMLEPLRRGADTAVMSEAGCPAVADPGADVVAIAQREGLKVVPLVGPSSILMGLMASGFNGQSFCFHGYLPIEERERREALQRLERESQREDRTQIFIETPYRNNKLIRLMGETLQSDTLVCVASAITDPEKEDIRTLRASQLKKINKDYDKTPAIFLLYRGFLAKGGTKIAHGKGRR